MQRDEALERSVETQRECKTPIPNYEVISLLIYYRSPLVTACTTDTTENNKTCDEKVATVESGHNIKKHYLKPTKSLNFLLVVPTDSKC